MVYPIVRKDKNAKYKISILKDTYALLCFFAQWSDCSPLNISWYDIRFTIYAKSNPNRILYQQSKNWISNTAINTPPLSFNTNDDPIKWKVCFELTKSITPPIDDFCWLIEWCCYCFSVVAINKTTQWDNIFLWWWEICIESQKCLSNTK